MIENDALCSTNNPMNPNSYLSSARVRASQSASYGVLPAKRGLDCVNTSTILLR